MPKNEIAEAIRDCFSSPNVMDSNFEIANIVDAIDGLDRTIRYGIKAIGLNDAATPMGAIEAHAVMIKEAAKFIADSIDNLAEAIRDFKA